MMSVNVVSNLYTKVIGLLEMNALLDRSKVGGTGEEDGAAGLDVGAEVDIEAGAVEGVSDGMSDGMSDGTSDGTSEGISEGLSDAASDSISPGRFNASSLVQKLRHSGGIGSASHPVTQASSHSKLQSILVHVSTM